MRKELRYSFAVRSSSCEHHHQARLNNDLTELWSLIAYRNNLFFVLTGSWAWKVRIVHPCCCSAYSIQNSVVNACV